MNCNSEQTLTLSDYAQPQYTGATLTGFTAQLLTAQDYYPFGSIMPERSFSSNGYRFGFNGKETDPEWSGSKGATYDYGFRIYDSRIAKFLSVDPLTKKYPELTTYQFASNTPIWAIDLDGLEAFYTADANLIGKYGESTEIRVVTNENIKNVSENLSWANNVKESYFKKYALAQALSYSKELIFNDSKAELKKMYGDADSDNKERIGFMVLDANKGEVSFKRDYSVIGTKHEAKLNYFGGYAYRGDQNTTVLQNVHTHQDDESYIQTDESDFNNQFSKDGDGDVAPKYGGAFTIGSKNVDYFSPAGKNKSKNNVTQRAKIENGSFNLAKKAFENYVKDK